VERRLDAPVGTAAEYVALPAAQAVALPDGLDLEMAPALHSSAHRLPRRRGGRGVEGKSVLISGGAGAVGTMRSSWRSSRMHGRSCHGEQRRESPLARSAGADVVLNYKEEDWVARCMEATDGVGLDRIIEWMPPRT